jgi:hypothetical protein
VAVSADAPIAPRLGATTALVAEALRRNQAEGGREYARAELIAALAGCCLYSIELDRLGTTLALLADAATVLERGWGSAVPAQKTTVH